MILHWSHAADTKTETAEKQLPKELSELLNLNNLDNDGKMLIIREIKQSGNQASDFQKDFKLEKLSDIICEYASPMPEYLKAKADLFHLKGNYKAQRECLDALLKIIDDIEGPQSISHGRMDAMEEIAVSHMNEYFHNMDLSRLSPSPSGEILDLFKKALIVNFEYYRRDDNIQRARLYAYISNLYAINNAINNEVIWALNAFKESANILRRLDLMRNRFVRPTHVD